MQTFSCIAELSLSIEQEKGFSLQLGLGFGLIKFNNPCWLKHTTRA
jgi:hypothetical protein